MPNAEQNQRNEQATSRLIRIPIIVGGLLILAYGIYFGLIRKQGTGGTDIWGQFGDFLGGLLNPIVGTITIILLVRTLMAQLNAVDMQREELTLQRDELKLQRAETAKSTEALAAQNNAIKMQSFEQTFFAWLQSNRQFVSSLHAEQDQGFKVLQRLVGPFASGTLDSVGTDFDRWAASHRQSHGRLLEIKFFAAQNGYENTYKNHHDVLGPLLRSLYRLIDWVDKSPIPDSDKWHYVAIARSQLTWPEMMILAYNGTTKRGERFAPLIEKYALLDNLEAASDYIVAAMRGPFLERQFDGFPYTKRAFNSGVAKLELGIIEAKDL